ncbi:peptidase inhibitor family I36 protein [Actinomadura bangladeshensis]|uniref:Uncharacterized protein n=1 Tax=Actinomadura bangladeshensis TaxID=453573 RepID=A0A4R4P8P8_9ACTN|nr:peptidase inhibitor family I36 protein [Actinomadura bangladeshensis]TDC18918.1 hypothetical protein E1284_04915 [Actinomadura bangladeshensis]
MIGLRGKAGVLAGAVLVAVTALTPLTAPPAHAGECRDNAGWWCLYADPGLQGLLIGTNNPGADVELIGQYGGLNDRADSVINRTSSYMGLYEDAGFQKPMLCLPPNSSTNQLPSDKVTSIRMRPGRAAACGGSAPAQQAAPKRTPKQQEEEGASSGKPKVSKSPSAKAKVSAPSQVPAPDATPTGTLPELDEPTPAVALPELAGTHPARPVSATSDDKGGLGTGALIVIGVGAGVIALLAALAVAGIFVRRRGASARREPKQRAVAPGADPEATRRVDRALRLLAVDCEQEHREVPAVRTVLLADTALTLVLAAPDADAPQPWRADGDRWTLAASDITELTDDIGPHRPFPLLVAVRPDTWVNLAETPGPIALDGTRGNARRAVRALSGLLGNSPWSDGVRIRMVGFGGSTAGLGDADVGDGEERARVVFVDDGRAVPANVPAGCAVIAVGRVPGARTTWPVRSGGALAVPPEARSSETGSSEAGSSEARSAGEGAAEERSAAVSDAAGE